MFWVYLTAAAINVLLLGLPVWSSGAWLLPVTSCALCVFGAWRSHRK